MYKVFKFLIIIIVFVILNCLISVVYALTLFIIIAIFHYDKDLNEFSVEKVRRNRLKVMTGDYSRNSNKDCKNQLPHENYTMNNSRFNNSTCSYSVIHKSQNGISNGTETRITSTPLSSMSMRHRKNHASTSKMRPILSSPRYSLSEISTPLNNGHSKSRIQSFTGPLLASTRYNNSLGTYTDCKSPGLTSRIVQYNNESSEERKPLTHQAKYNSPSLFPIVHFFKPEVPVISPKPKRVTIKIANPNTSYTTFEQNRILAESMTQDLNNSKRQESTDTDISTRSVLDALKEISRKRIHATTDYDLDEDTSNKRQRTELINGTAEYSKRNREDSPPAHYTDNSNHKVKRMCLVDPVMASFSSSRLYCQHVEINLKRKPTEQLDESCNIEKEPKKRTSCNVETQTLEELSEKKAAASIPKENIQKLVEEKMETNTKTTLKKVPEQKSFRQNIENIVIFNEDQLEINRKNKLAKLLGALMGDEPDLIPHTTTKIDLSSKENFILDKEVESVNVEKPKSILSPLNKPKHEKHVSFNIPTSEADNEILSDKESSSNSIEISVDVAVISAAKEQIGSQFITTETTLTSSVTSPISFGSTLSMLTNKSTNILSTTGQTSQSPVFSATSPNNAAQKVGGFKFEMNASGATSTSSPTFTKPLIVSNDNLSSNKNSVSLPIANSVSNVPPPPFGTNTTTSSGFGNFASPTTNASAPSIMFGAKIPTSSTTTTTTNLGFTFGATKSTTITNPTTTISSPLFSMPVPQSQTTIISNAVSNTATTTTTVASISSTKPVIFGEANGMTFASSNNTAFSNTGLSFGSNQNNTNTSGFGTSTSAAMFNPPSNAPLFGGATNVPSFSTASTKATFGAVAPTFGSTSVSTTGFTTNTTNTPAIFGANTTTTSSVLPFGANSTKGSIFGGKTAFGGQTTSAFSVPATTVTFGGSSGTGFGMPVTSTAFGISSNNSFGAPSTVAGFVDSSLGAGGFTSSSTTTTQSIVSPFAKPTTSTAVFGFGTTTSTSPSAFGSTASTGFGSVFGATTSAGANLNNNNNSSFNTVSTPAFGSGTTTNTFGSGFGTANNSIATGFGTTNTTIASGFGTTNTTIASGFGTTNTTIASGFGTQNTAIGFGTPSTSIATGFGTPSTTSLATGFGQSSGSSFTFVSKASTGFGAGNNNSTFGAATTSATPSFGFTTPSTQAPAFGSNNNTFGNNNQPSFGNTTTTTTAANVFGAANTPSFTSNPGGFGAASSGFGFGAGNNTGSAFPTASNNTPFAATGGFGSSNNQTSFGNADSTFGKQPTNAFNNSSFPANNFSNANNNNTFGTPSTQANNSSFAFNNTTPNSNAGVFTFGANAPSNQATSNVFAFGGDKPKGGFNFTSNTNNPTSPFGNTQNAPAFGSPQPPSFGANTSFNGPSQQFNVPGAPGMFNIGSGTTSSRPRQQLKAKRRTQI